MSSNNHADPIFKGKRVPKSEVKLGLTLNEEQKEAKQVILDNPITVVVGYAGSGKTLVACSTALTLLFKKEVERIIITRPTVAREEIGFLPGTLQEKMDPWLAPIYSNLYLLYRKEKIDEMIKDGIIEIVPLAFMRGRTFLNAVVIGDEQQNSLQSDLELLLGRLGKNSKMILTYDGEQIDLKDSTKSSYHFIESLNDNDLIRIVKLRQNHRHEIVPKVLELFRTYREKKSSKKEG